MPNQITVCRLILAGVFFLVLNQYRYSHGPPWALLVALALFVLGAITDWLDGYLARRWKAESAFGRIMDPFCDKVLVLGAFIYLAGPRFVNPSVVDAHELSAFMMLPGNMISGVYPWMVAVMFAREMLVTNIRGEFEERGVQFGAKLSGKLKTVLQLVTVPVVLAIVWVDPETIGCEWMRFPRDVLVYATVVVTIISGIPYIRDAARALRDTREG